MSQANSSSQCPSQAVFNQAAWDFQVHAIQEQIVLASLPSALYGIFVILTMASIHALARQHRPRDKFQPPIVSLSLTLFALFAATTAYLLTLLLSVQSAIINLILDSPSVIWGLPSTIVFGLLAAAKPRDYNQIRNCTGTAALTLNILLGDAIVCWRACVLWRGHRPVKALCALFLAATFALGMVDTVFTCAPTLDWTPDAHSTGTGLLYQGLSYGVAASVLSLATNLLATLLVGYKAWTATRFFQSYVVAGPVASQIEKVFTLLLESGAVYCTVWTAVVVWQVGMRQPAIGLHPGINTFWDIFGVLVNGALVPLIAIYPTIIIVLVALNRSQVEHGLMRAAAVSHDIAFAPGTAPLMSSQAYESESGTTESTAGAGGRAHGMDMDMGMEGRAWRGADQPKREL